MRFPPLQLDVAKEFLHNDESIEAFLLERQREDEERGKQAVIELQKRSETVTEQTEDNGPLVIGYQIQGDQDYRKLEEITEEERRIVVEGYILLAKRKSYAVVEHYLNLK